MRDVGTVIDVGNRERVMTRKPIPTSSVSLINFF